MPPSQPPRVDWNAVLATMEAALQATIQQAEAREAAAPKPGDASATQAANYSQRQAELEHRAQAARAKLERLDLALQAEERAMREHLTAAAELRQKLADWSARAVA